MPEAPKANPVNLMALIRDVYNAKVVVPEFQRSFVWTRQDIEDFLTSLLYGYFTGTFLMLETSATEPMFPFRSVEGVERVNPQVNWKDHGTVQLVLDGQQRITSLFYALYEPDITLSKGKKPYRFYLNFEEALKGNIDEAVVGISGKDGKRSQEYKKLCKEGKAVRFSLLHDSNKFHEWLYSNRSEWLEQKRNKIREIYENIDRFMVPVVSLSPQTSKGDIVNIFERINRTGVNLSIFDLAVAQLYRKNIKLRELWREVSLDNGIGSEVKPEFLLRVVALLQGKEIRKSSLLDAIDLEPNVFNKLWNQAVESIVEATQQMTQKYGAFSPKWIPYTTLVIPLAIFLHKLKANSAYAENYQKLDRWYWACVFSSRYDNAVDTKTHQDVREVGAWLAGGFEPQWLQQLSIQDLNFDFDETQQSASYRGIMNLIVCKGGAKDLLSGQRVDPSELEDESLFPKSFVKKSGEDYGRTILCRTLISKQTNKIKAAAKTPSEFLQECLDEHGGDELKLLETLKSHFISMDAYLALKENNIDGFIAERRKTIQEVVQSILELRE
ncbi:MAG: DUF262 domain-containing protein [Oscillatoriaceae bacterium SKW80]|nr:DUF262 domain-containing protein [Oscillatoriaceae bacterium SKYG93]MCX8120439.1 DUF262 domain-containing protein [Oscillatoriaceae bacterium SKW80]MDW8452986.1 DUF262 domain-containing protein [Oscillatoriaceae cyanobacterium SKYGB_i_bin93]HIK28583.1 DUF262 domain-containing protein [Oscillatoriaceae cyanobacterium M7585_C2015_266]